MAIINNSRNQPVRCSTVLVFLVSMLVVGVCLSAVIVFFMMSQHAPRLCLSEECVSMDFRINASMDRTIEPCDDFYQFACGGWEQRNPIPEWAVSWSTMATLQDRLSRNLRILLEEGDNEELPKSVIKAKALYKMCMNTESNSLMPIKEILELIGLPSYPPGSGPDLNDTSALNDTSVNGTTYNEKGVKRSWQTAAGRAQRLLGLDVLIGLGVISRNTSRNWLVVDQVSPGFSERYLINSTKFSTEISQYKKSIISMIHRFDPETNAKQFAEDIIQFSTGLAQIMTPSEERSELDTFREVSIIQLTEGGPDTHREMPWGEYLDEVFKDTKIGLSPNDTVFVRDLSYLQKLAVMLKATDNVVIEKFVWWRVLSTVYNELGFIFSKKVFGYRHKTPRWMDCTTYVNNNFGMALSYLYVRRHFDRNSSEKAIAMLEDVKQAFSGTVTQLDWMDNSTRYKTLNKLKAIINLVGSPSLKEMLETTYEDTDIVEENLFETHLKLKRTSVKKNLESLREKPDRKGWLFPPTTINAFYLPTLNSVTFPAAILQPPFTGNEIEAINYGSIGAVMGHEIMHGFDDQGKQYDEHGNLKQWWSAATLEHYHEKVQCIVDQYNQYHLAQLPNYTVDGFNTQGENIADNGGLRAALRAYDLLSSRNAAIRRERLPSMKQYTPRQLFFLGFAQVWCGNSTVAALKSGLVNNVHSPNKIRVIGTLSNSKEFSEAWSCPVGSPMNPEHKCVLCRDKPIRHSSELVFLVSKLVVGVCLSAVVVFFGMSQLAPHLRLFEEYVSTDFRIIASMDHTVEPCDNFYQFACGGWEQRNPIPEWAMSWSTMAMLQDRLTRNLRILLEEGDNEELPKSVVKAKALYKMCMNTESNSLMPIKEILELIGLPSYPPGSAPDLNNTRTLNNTSVNGTTYNEKGVKRSWQTAAGRAQRLLGLDVLIGLGVISRNTSRNWLVVDQVFPGFSERYLINSTKFSAEIRQYKEIITSMIHTFDPETNADQFAEDILQFSTGLAQIMTTSEKRRSELEAFHEVSIIQLTEGGPDTQRDMQWGEYLDEVFKDTKIGLSPNDTVFVRDLSYLQKLAVMLKATDNVVIEKFVWWRVLSTVYDELGFTFSEKVFGYQHKTPRWMDCTTYVNNNFGMALSYLYVRRHFDRDSSEKAIAMLEDVKQAFSGTVTQLDWMDNSTRYKTLNKLKAIINLVGSPSLTEMLETTYEDTDIVEGKLFETYLELKRTSVKKNLESLREKPDRKGWLLPPTTVNAFYFPTLNSVTFPAAILQPPFTGNEVEAINYGSMGAVMGHEILHGFVDKGKQYDEHGNLKQWWSADTLEHYHEKVQCIIDQYNQYHMAELPNYTVDGFNTQGENMADNGGLRAALLAYDLLSSRNASIKRERLPSMKQYTPRQLFFLGFAQVWCGNSTVAALKSGLVNSIHSPNKIRVIGTLSNSKEFSEAWSCPVGSPMNPEHKCVLW